MESKLDNYTVQPKELGTLKPELLIRASTLEDEFRYLTGELLPRYSLYRQYGYTSIIPDSPAYLDVANYGLVSEQIEKLRNDLLSIYSEKYYTRGLSQLSQLSTLWPIIITGINDLNTRWGFETYQTYEVRLTRFGTGGDYYPSHSAFDGKPRPQPGLDNAPADERAIVLMRVDEQENFGRMNPLQTAVHEMVHLGIENIVVQKYKLSHWEKERLVDLICRKKFGEIFPDYQLQEKGDSRIDQYITEEKLSNLPLAVESYVKEFPRG